MSQSEPPDLGPAVRPPPTTDALLAAMKTRLEAVARPFGDTVRRIDALLAEATPFVESTRRALDEGPLEASLAWREARSFVWLLAYRLGDQSWPAPVAAAVVPAWRDALGVPGPQCAADELQALMTEGFARGREDRVRSESQKSLAESLPVAEVAPQVVVIVAAGPLDPDGARALADRASAFLLRRDARAVLLDLEGLLAPSPAVLVELWSMTSAARLLGVRMVVSGVRGVVGEMVRTANLHDEGERRVETLAEGVEVLLREAGVALGGRRGFGTWLRGLLGGRAKGSTASKARR
jgi:anti-anti-sigma regulatory factor